MARVISDTVKAHLYALNTDEPFLVLLEVDEPTLAEPIRLVANSLAITHDGDVYLPMWFEVGLPEDDGESLGETTLVIDNIDRAVGDAVRSVSGRPTALMSLVSETDWDEVLAGPFDLEIEQVEISQTTATATAIAPEGLFNWYPFQVRTQTTEPGIY